jgi:succinate dehydrogenase hydrophobic anchor subunit
MREKIKDNREGSYNWAAARIGAWLYIFYLTPKK